MKKRAETPDRRLVQERAAMILLALAILAASWMAFFRPEGGTPRTDGVVPLLPSLMRWSL